MRKIIRKNNAVTNSHIMSNIALTRKLVNSIYSLYERQGAEIKTSFYELINLLGLETSGRTYKEVKLSLSELTKSMYFEDRKKWIQAPFLTFIMFEKEPKILTIEINSKLLKAINNTRHWTKLNLKIINKFSSSYALVIYEIYKRYEKNKIKGFPKNTTGKSYNLKEINKKFGTNFKEARKLNESIKRGILEIKKKTNIDIFFFYSRGRKSFDFSWFYEDKKHA